MAKYARKKQKTKKSSQLTLWVVAACCIALPVAIIAISWVLQDRPAEPANPTTATTPTVSGGGNVLVPSFPTVPDTTTQPSSDEPQYPYLNESLVIDHIGSYAGIYTEDGSDEIVANTMMLIVKNTGSQDLQLARINLQYSDFEANFEVTNLPAGERIVLLERSRHAYVEEKPQGAMVKDLVFFPEAMDLMEDKITISGGDGYMEVTNITVEDLTGEFFIYYKNSASDLLYGGITYRVRISGGIGAGQTVRIMSKHYHPDRCTIVMVSYFE